MGLAHLHQRPACVAPAICLQARPRNHRNRCMPAACALQIYCVGTPAPLWTPIFSCLVHVVFCECVYGGPPHIVAHAEIWHNQVRPARSIIFARISGNVVSIGRRRCPRTTTPATAKGISTGTTVIDVDAAPTTECMVGFPRREYHSTKLFAGHGFHRAPKLPVVGAAPIQHTLG